MDVNEFEETSENGSKKNYCNKQFKRNLIKAIRSNNAEPNNIEKIRGNRTLHKYSSEKITEFVNKVAKDVQKRVEESIDDPEAHNTFQLTHLVNDISNRNKSQELALAMKVKAESMNIPNSILTNNVDFKGLTRFLYTAMSGLPDCNSLDQKSRQVLYNTHALLMDQVNKDATPEFLEKLKSKICTGSSDQPHVGVENLAANFQDKSLNPFGFPLEFLLKGALPPQDEPDAGMDPIQIFSTMSYKKDCEGERSAIEILQVEDVTSSEKVPHEK